MHDAKLVNDLCSTHFDNGRYHEILIEKILHIRRAVVNIKIYHSKNVYRKNEGISRWFELKRQGYATRKRPLKLKTWA
jgi:hypothetical protein